MINFKEDSTEMTPLIDDMILIDNEETKPPSEKVIVPMKKVFTIDELEDYLKDMPQENFYYSGIKEKTVNILAAPPKVGKTTLVENLAMSIAAGCSTYLNKPIWFGENQKVLIVNLEERLIARGNRHRLQREYMDSIIGNSSWHDNFLVIGDDAPKYFQSNEDWKWLLEQIKEHKPALTIIDSISRLQGGGSIEDSSTAIDLMQKLKNIVDETDTTILTIHHMTKIGSEALTIFKMAGSRILSQEADAIIGMNKTPGGKRYIKPLAFRYADDSAETVDLFTFSKQHHWLTYDGCATESSLLKETDERYDSINRDRLFEYFLEVTVGDTSVIVETKNLEKALVETKIMSSPTLHSAIDKLIQEKVIQRQSKGKYSLSLPALLP